MITQLDANLSRQLTRIADFHCRSVYGLVEEVLRTYVNQTQAQIPAEHELTACLSDPAFQACATQIDRMKYIWGYARKHDARKFDEIAPRLRGPKRQYAAPNSAVIEASGRSTDPKLISTNDYWICGNLPLSRKRKITSRLLKHMGFSRAAIRDAVAAI